MTIVTALLVIFTIFVQISSGYRILGVFPHHGLSHYMMFEPLMLELARRGHEVVVISKYPHKEKVPNYQHIDVNNESPSYTNNLPFHMFYKLPVSLAEDLIALYTYVYVYILFVFESCVSVN